MRRSKRLATKKSTKCSETEGSSQEEVADVKGHDVEAVISKDYGFVIDKTPSHIATRTRDHGDHEDEHIEALISTDHDFVIDKTPSHVATSTSDHEYNDVDDNSDGDERDEDVDSLSNVRTTSSQEEEEQEEDFITLSSEFKTKLKDSSQLSSELQVDINTEDLYLKFDKTSFKPVTFNKSFNQFAFNDKELMKRSVITKDFEKRHSVPPMHVSQHVRRKQKKKAREETAGPMWFNLPATQITPEIEQDMKIMKMRNILDRKRHYKKNDSAALPKYFQIGTVVEGSTDFYASRIPKRQRKSNMIDELLSDAEFRRYNKRKYLEIQAAKQSGKKGFYKKKMNKRKATALRS